jgi:hypothetical protein
MIGAIRTWDILSHPAVTIQCFGWRIFFGAAFTGQGKSFLSLLHKAGFCRTRTSDAVQFIERCIGLELQLRQTYTMLAVRFARSRAVNAFLADLAEQEQSHADLLEVCQAALRHGRWEVQYVEPWRERVSLLGKEMETTVASLDTITSVEDALRLVIKLESSEINQAFLAVIKATDSAFVRKVRAFRKSVTKHIAYICQRIPQLAPSTNAASQKLRDKVFV